MSLAQTFGTYPLIGPDGSVLRRVGRIEPVSLPTRHNCSPSPPRNIAGYSAAEFDRSNRLSTSNEVDFLFFLYIKDLSKCLNVKIATDEDCIDIAAAT